MSSKVKFMDTISTARTSNNSNKSYVTNNLHATEKKASTNIGYEAVCRFKNLRNKKFSYSTSTNYGSVRSSHAVRNKESSLSTSTRYDNLSYSHELGNKKSSPSTRCDHVNCSCTSREIPYTSTNYDDTRVYFSKEMREKEPSLSTCTKYSDVRYSHTVRKSSSRTSTRCDNCELFEYKKLEL